MYMKARTPKQILEHLRQLKEKLSPDLEKKVGKVIFGSDDRIVKLQKLRVNKDGSSVEPDTNWENQLYAQVNAWSQRSDNSLAKYFAKNKELLQTLAKEFPSVLRPPIGKQVYRGTSIKTDSLKAAFMKKQYKVIKVGGREVFHFKNLEYSPMRDSQSWTVDPKVAFKFEGDANNESKVHVVYTTKVNKDFIFSPELMNIIFVGKESEVVRIGKKGTFEALVDSSVFLNTWKLEPKDNFIHKLTKAKPFFEPIIIKYNRMAAKDNKKWGEELVPPARNIEDMIAASVEDIVPAGYSLNRFSLGREYASAVQKFIKSVKDK